MVVYVHFLAFTVVALTVFFAASTTSPSSGGSNSTGYPCQYCGKLFSNQSNRRRHAVLSCELARVAGVEPRKSRDEVKTEKKSLGHQQTKFENPHAFGSEDFYYEDGAPGSRSTEPQDCPFPDCEVSFMRSALLKRHLAEEHNVQNVSAELTAEVLENSAGSKKIKTEPVDMLEIQHNDIADNDETDRKVPPLRVKISQVVSQKSPTKPKKESPKKDPAKVHTCSFCNGFKSNNLYILGRHQKSCEKKMADVKQVENGNSIGNNEEEDEKNDTIDTTAEEHDVSGNGNDDSSDEEEGDTTVEVPVDFEATTDEPDENDLDGDANDIANEGEESMIMEPETTLNEQPDDEDDEMEIAQDSNDNPKKLINNDNSNEDFNIKVDKQSNETEKQHELDTDEENPVQSSEPDVAE